MRLPFRCTHESVLSVCSALFCAVVIALAVPSAARASNGDDGRPRDEHVHHKDGGWRGPWIVPPPFGVRVYPGYYPAPIYSAPYTPYYAPPPPHVELPPKVLSFGFRWQ